MIMTSQIYHYFKTLIMMIQSVYRLYAKILNKLFNPTEKHLRESFKGMNQEVSCELPRTVWQNQASCKHTKHNVE